MKMVGLILALALAGAARAEPATVNLEELHLYPERFNGRTIAVEGVITMAEKSGSIVVLGQTPGGRVYLPVFWADKTPSWERAISQCHTTEHLPECRARVSGIVEPVIKGELYAIGKASVDFVAAK